MEEYFLENGQIQEWPRSISMGSTKGEFMKLLLKIVISYLASPRLQRKCSDMLYSLLH